MHPEVENLLFNWDVINKSGKGHCHQGWDAVLEEANKDVKCWIPAHPNENHWIQSARLWKILRSLRKLTLDVARLTDVSSNERKRSRPLNSDDILRWAAYLEKIEYFSKKKFTSIDNVELHQDLLRFRQIACERQRDFFTNLIAGKDGKAHPPIFTTIEAAQNYEKTHENTINFCSTRITEILSGVDEENNESSYKYAISEEDRKSLATTKKLLRDTSKEKNFRIETALSLIKAMNLKLAS
eukprot:Pompholyxophrys_punicea_v1_NODE_10_length_6905_cov_7.951686.p5 type:complete len:241 gc:universal NODE_10_length_6905_cov_7.951686:910-188(-)